VELIKQESNNIDQLAKDILEIKQTHKGKVTEMLLSMKWKIGEAIVNNLSISGDRGHQDIEIQNQSFRELEVKTGVDRADLQRSCIFYNNYPNKEYPILAWRKLRLGIEKEEENIIIDIPKNEYQVYVIDPPWKYDRKYDPNTSRVASPYKEIETDEMIKQFKEKLNPYKDSIMFLWTTQKFIWDAKLIIDELNFEYKACFVWDKEIIGMGYWLRMQCEFCLLATKGKPEWNNTKIRDLIREKRREHSRKPEIFNDIVRELTPNMKRAYIFTREKIEGFDSFGDEIEKF
jgi:N6-adenosine-specific RNA methylase IME4